MKNIIFILTVLFSISVLNATELIQNNIKNLDTEYTAEYSVTYSVFGEVARAKSSLQVDKNNHFIIKSSAQTKGVARTLLGERKDSYYSKGLIYKDQFLPFVFTKLIKTDEKHSKKTYTFNHRKKEIVVASELAKESNGWELKTWNKKNKFYATSDILSLFFNFINEFSRFEYGKTYQFTTIGTNPKDGILKIIFPDKKEKKEIQKTLETKSEKIFKVFLRKKIFYSKTGELLVALDKDGLCEKAVLKDVAMLGDVNIIRVK